MLIHPNLVSSEINYRLVDLPCMLALEQLSLALIIVRCDGKWKNDKDTRYLYEHIQ